MSYRYYYHPASQVSQWEDPREQDKVRISEQQRASVRVSHEQGNEKTRKEALGELEDCLALLLQHNELDLDQLNMKVSKDTATRRVVEGLVKLCKASRSRNIGVRKDGTLSREFFDSRPMFRTRFEGDRVCISVAQFT